VRSGIAMMCLIPNGPEAVSEEALLAVKQRNGPLPR
jgi:hypothetical protein